MTDCHAVLTDALRQNLQLAEYTRQVADQLAEALVQNGQLRALNAELLAALKLAEGWLHEGEGEGGLYDRDTVEAMAIVRAALAKAEGEA
jgi:hypothetical protein